jgi:hypothetical protein
MRVPRRDRTNASVGRHLAEWVQGPYRFDTVGTLRLLTPVSFTCMLQIALPPVFVVGRPPQS